MVVFRWLAAQSGPDFRSIDDITGAGDTAAASAVPGPPTQRNFADPDARLMKTPDGSFHYCYNGQAVVDSHQLVIVAAEMTPADTPWFE